MNQTEMIKFLSRIEIFHQLTTDELKKIGKRVIIKQFEANQPLFQENSEREYLYLVYKGEIELFKISASGQEKRLAFFGPNDFLGEGALLDDLPHSTSARTLMESTLLLIKVNEFRSLFKENTELAGKIISHIARIISRRMQQANARVASVAAQYLSGRTRTEHDLLGERKVPYEFYYGIQTLRALDNFNITGVPLSHYPKLIEALVTVKMAAAKANYDLNLLDKKLADTIVKSCCDILNGKLHTQFVVDMIQGGAGTSTNMNANEVIANRALELMGYEKGQYEYCHPNNHVNLSQSTNDAYPTALKIALINSNQELLEVLGELITSLQIKGDEFAHMIKMGRTQLQDAVPMTLGQEFTAYAATLKEEVDRLEQNARLFLEVNMGGTAIGTGINTDPRYSNKVIEHLRDITGLDITLAPNLVEATQDTGAFVMYSSALKRLALKLSKIANDLRLLSSGPRAGLYEIVLPKMQPGSSIMPGKVNPVIPEVVNQIAYKVIGNDLTVSMAAEAGQLELNVMEPVIAQSLFESLEMLKNGMSTFMQRCIDGITANEERMLDMVKNSIGLVTALNPILGYEKCTEIAKEALTRDKGVYELVLEKGWLSKKELDKLLAPETMLSPHSSQE
ncbi:MAG TPA: aspartate ammonia-lyase [Calditrichaeota bacterium]|nr:aspartate ammonia-lyase [Calditrichota bacterium]